MQTLIRSLGCWSAALALSACAKEGVIGQERCVGANTRCTPTEERAFDPAPGPIDVDTQTEREARVAFRVQNWCAECGSSPVGPPKLIADAVSGVWGVGRTESLPGALHYAHVTDDGQIDLTGAIAPPDAYPELNVTEVDSVLPLPGGGLVLSIDWSALNPAAAQTTTFAQEAVRVTSAGTTRVVVNTLPAPRNTPLVSFSTVPSGDEDSVVFLFSYGEKIVRKIDAQGHLIWQQTELPSWANVPGVTLPSGDGSVLFASEKYSADSRGTQGLVWFDADGNILRAARISTAYDPVRLSSSRVAVVLPSWSSLTDAGVVYVVDLAVERLGLEGVSVGHHLLSQGFTGLAVQSLTSDPEDNVYVSFLSGTREAPRTTLCMLPEAAEGACYLGPEGLIPTMLAAPSAGVVYALDKNEIVRLDLSE